MGSTNVPDLVRPVPALLPGQAANLDGQSSWIDEVELREYWRVIFKYRLIIGACAAFAVLFALVYMFTVTPLFSAVAKVRIGMYEPALSGTKVEDLLQQQSKDSLYLETQIQQLTSLSLADRVLQNEKIKAVLDLRRKSQGFWAGLFGSAKNASSNSGDEIISQYKNSLPVLKDYLEKLNVRPVRKTSLVELEFTDESPQVAAVMANTHASTYIDWMRLNRVEQQSRGLAFLRGQADELREKVADLERQRADYAEENAIIALNKDENITVSKMSDLNKLLTEATGKRIEAVNFYKEAQNSDSKTAGFDDSSLQTMRSQLAQLESERSQLSAKFTDSYPKMRQIDSQIAGLKQSITGQQQQVVRGLKAKAMAAQQEEENLREELEKQKSLAFDLSKRQVQYNVIDRELSSSRDLLQSLLREIKETSLAVESNSSNVSVVDFAAVPLKASYPNKKLALLLGLVGGLTLGIGAAFILSYLDNTIRTPEEMMHVLRLPSLGVVPSFELEKALNAPAGGAENEGAEQQKDLPFPAPAQKSALPVVFFDNPKSLAAEAYRTIRTGILLSQAGEPPRTILVSSAQSSEGKTTSSLNLAASLASTGGQVALIDADLRRPSVVKYFSGNREVPGLVEVLTGQMSLEQVVRRNFMKHVTVIPSGSIPPNPAELLGSREMAGLIDYLGTQFDYVVIDCPPILPVTDAVILSRYVDGVVLVVKGGATPKRVVLDAKNRLQAVGARILGVILNDVDVTGGDYYYYSRYYYSYYHEGQKRSAKERAAS